MPLSAPAGPDGENRHSVKTPSTPTSHTISAPQETEERDPANGDGAAILPCTPQPPVASSRSASLPYAPLPPRRRSETAPAPKRPSRRPPTTLGGAARFPRLFPPGITYLADSPTVACNSPTFPSPTRVSESRPAAGPHAPAEVWLQQVQQHAGQGTYFSVLQTLHLWGHSGFVPLFYGGLWLTSGNR